jgi:small multidrug resistance pump
MLIGTNSSMKGFDRAYKQWLTVRDMRPGQRGSEPGCDQENTMTWLYLVLAILLEVSGTTCMKLSEGFTRMVPSILLVVFYTLSLGMLTLALKKIDVSVAYAIWSGVGTALIATIGVLWFKEPATALKLISLGLIIIGVVGLNLSGGAH